MAAVVGVTLVLWLSGIRLYAFPGVSMVPAVKPGDYFIGLEGPWRLRTPQRFDRVIFDVPSTSRWAGQGIPWMKRLVGLPREHVRLSGDTLYIDGAKVNAPCLHRDRADSPPKEIELVLGDRQYFVVGDNLDHSFDDSRSMGPIDKSLLRGFAALVIHTSLAE